MIDNSILKKIKVSEWERPKGWDSIVCACFIKYEATFSKNNEQEEFFIRRYAAIADSEWVYNKEEVSDDELNELKKEQIRNAVLELVKEFSEIEKKKEMRFKKAFEGPGQRDKEGAIAMNDKNRTISYREDDKNFYVKIKDVELKDFHSEYLQNANSILGNAE